MISVKLTESFHKEEQEQTNEIQRDFRNSMGQAWDIFIQRGIK